jgi:hypothetical protein
MEPDGNPYSFAVSIISAQQQAVESALAAADRAVTKAEADFSKRLDALGAIRMLSAAGSKSESKIANDKSTPKPNSRAFFETP